MKKIIVLVLMVSILSGCSLIKGDKAKQMNGFDDSNSDNEESLEVIKGNDSFYVVIDSENLPNISNYNSNEGFIYFSSDADDISKINLENGEISQVLNEKALDLIVIEDRLIYKKENNKIVIVNLESGEKVTEITLEIAFDFVTLEGDDLYYIEANNLKKKNIISGKEEIVFQFGSLNISIDEFLGNKFDKLFYKYRTEGHIMIGYFDLEQGEWIDLASIDSDKVPRNVFNIQNDYVYFIEVSSTATLKKMDSTGNIKTELTSIDIKDFMIENNHLYIMINDGMYSDLYLVEGENKTLIEKDVIESEISYDEIYFVKVVEENNSLDWSVWKANYKGENKCPILNFDDKIINGLKVTNEDIYVALQDEISVYSKFLEPLYQIDGYKLALTKAGECIYFMGDNNRQKIFAPVFLEDGNTSNEAKDVENDVDTEEVENPVSVDTEDNTEIGNNTETDEDILSDDEFKINELIHNFDYEWENFANDSVNEVEKYLTKDSKVHSFIENFDSDNIEEEFIQIRVDDVKVNGNNAEAYVYEKIKKTTGDNEKIVEYNWIYYVEKVDGEWLVDTYKKQ
ncbi:hypothetical protein [Clostridium sp. DL1XJH146]